MLGGWAGLKNGPLVPEAITKVTSSGPVMDTSIVGLGNPAPV